MRTGVCTNVLSGDTITLDGGYPKLRYINVWAPTLDTPVGQALLEKIRAMVLGKEVQYLPSGHLHWDNESILADVYVDGVWMNQELRYWLSDKIESPQWVGGIPGPDNKPHAPIP